LQHFLRVNRFTESRLSKLFSEEKKIKERVILSNSKLENAQKILQLSLQDVRVEFDSESKLTSKAVICHSKYS
jgi:hypothetical protein